MPKLWRRWTPGEELALRRLLAAGKDPAQAGVKLGRPAESVRGKVYQLGLTGVWVAARKKKLADEIVRLYAAGLTDREVSRRLGCCRCVVQSVRNAAGVAGDARRRYGRRNYNAQMRSVGARNIGHYRWQRDRHAAVSAGWPAGCTTKQARFLALLELRPMTRHQLAAALGLPIDTGPRLFWIIKKYGWVEVARRRATGRGAPQAYYRLSEPVALGRRAAAAFRDRNPFLEDV